MSRWGPEEKKSQGIWGCLFALAVLVFFSLFFYKNYERMEDRRLLEKEVQKICRSAQGQKEDKVVARILEAADNLGITLKTEDVELNLETEDGYDVLKVWINIKFDVWLVFMDREITLPITEKLVLVY